MQSECMFCKHPHGEQDTEQIRAKQLVEVLGLSEEYLLAKIRDNGVFTDSDCKQIRVHVNGSHEFDLPLPDQRVSDWESAQCGKLRLSTVDEDVPAPFSPVMAGILIASEIVKEKNFPEAVLDSYYFNSLLERFNLRIAPHRRRPRPDCQFCTDSAFRDQYNRRWDEAALGT